MHIFFALAWIAASIMMLVSAKAQVWQYIDNADPITGEASEASTWLLKEDNGTTTGYIWIGCRGLESSGLEPHEEKFLISVVVDPELFAKTLEVTRRPVRAWWQVDDRDVMEFMADGYDGGYMVSGKKGVELTQTLVNAMKFATSDGNGMVQFDNLRGEKPVQRVLEICVSP